MPKSLLTPLEQIKVAYAHHVLGIKQQDIHALYPHVNNGRINEACKAVGAAVGLTSPGYKERGE